MTFQEVREILSQIRYKPQHELVYERHGEEILIVYWEFLRPDCYNPSEWGNGRSGPITIYLPEIYSKEQLVRMVFGMTMRLEEHEAREFFLFNGDRPFDPHVPLIKDDSELPPIA